MMLRAAVVVLAAVGCAPLAGAQGADMLDLEDTFVENAEKTREVTSVEPRYGSTNGGTRLHVKGTGFATEFYSGSNTVFIGSESKGWVGCDVIEGACTVDCGGDKKVVCDTQAWTSDDYPGWLDVWVVVEDSVSTYDLVLANGFYYMPSYASGVPRLTLSLIHI